MVVATALFVVPARINVPCFRSSAVILSPLPRWIPRPTIDRLISVRDRSDATFMFAENSGRTRQRLITIFVLRDLSLPKPPPLRESLSSVAVSSFTSSSSCSSSPSTSLFVVVLALFYSSSYSRAQFCVLLPPVTLAENNNNICSPPLDKGRQWFVPCCS